MKIFTKHVRILENKNVGDIIIGGTNHSRRDEVLSIVIELETLIGEDRYDIVSIENFRKDFLDEIEKSEEAQINTYVKVFLKL